MLLLAEFVSMSICLRLLLEETPLVLGFPTAPADFQPTARACSNTKHQVLRHQGH